MDNNEERKYCDQLKNKNPLHSKLCGGDRVHEII